MKAQLETTNQHARAHGNDLTDSRAELGCGPFALCLGGDLGLSAGSSLANTSDDAEHLCWSSTDPATETKDMGDMETRVVHELPIWNIRQQQRNTRANCDHWHHLSVHKALACLKGQLCRLEEKAESAKMGMRSPKTDTCMVPFFILGNLEEQHDGASEPYIKSKSSPTATTTPVTSRNTRSLTAPSFKQTRRPEACTATMESCTS